MLRSHRVVRLLVPVLALPIVVVGAASNASAGLLPPPIAATVHPRLLFTAQDLPVLRARIAVPGVPASAWARLHERAEGLLAEVQPDLVRSSQVVQQNIAGTEVDETVPFGLQNEMPTYLIELGMAYQLSGDARYGRRVVDLLLALTDANYPFWCCQDLGVGDLLEGIGLGFDWSYELMTPAERLHIVSAMWTPDHERLLFGRTLGYNPQNAYAANLEISNWMGVTSGGAGLTLLAIRGEPGIPTNTLHPFDEYLDRALSRTRSYFVSGVDPQGANHEGMTYSVYGLKNAIPFALAARREGLGDIIAGTGLPSMARWASMELLPGQGQSFVPLNDSQRTQYGTDFEAQMFAIAPGNGVAQWLWQRTVGPKGSDYFAEPHVPQYLRDDKCRRLEPISLAGCDLYQFHGIVWTILWYRTPSETPEVDPATVGPLSVHYAQRGLIDARTGFAGEGNEAISTFEALRDGRGHFQFDAGNFTLYGDSERWAIDPGYACVACGHDENEAQATAHNVVIVDGARGTQSQNLRYWRGTTIDSFVNAPNVSLTHADLRYAYSADPNAALDPPYAGRDHLFSRVPGRPVLLAVADQLQRDASGAPHTYTWQMMTDKLNLLTTSGSGFTIASPSGATLVGDTAADGSPAADPVMQQRREVLNNSTDDEGSPEPVVYDTSLAQRAMDHLAVLALTPAGQSAATISNLRVTGGNALAVAWNGPQDIVVRKLAAASSVTGPVETDGGIAKLTTGAGESVLRGGTYLRAFGRDYVSVDGAPATVTVSGNQISALGSDSNNYRVFAPQAIASVSVNGNTVSSCRVDSYVQFPCVQTALRYSGETLAQGNSIATSAVLTDSHGTPLPGFPISCQAMDDAVTTTTDYNGVASASLSVPDHGQSQVVICDYAGAPRFLGSSTSVRVYWGRTPSV